MEQFHDLLPESNSNRIPKNLRGICVKLQLSGRSLDFCKRTPDDVIASDRGFNHITAAIYKRDALKVVSDVYHDSNSLLNVCRAQNESYLNYASRFSVQVAKLAGQGETFKLHDALLALMLLSNAGIGDAQIVLILANLGHSRSKDRPLSNDQIIEDIMNEYIAFVIRQCEKGGTLSNDSSGRLLSHNSSFVRNVGENGRQNTRSDKKHVSERYQAVKILVSVPCMWLSWGFLVRSQR